ncbi:hydrogenase nickel incorporation protein HypB [Vibrio variabilis]|uniref:hydrogenase nickel incorporation protein HypB n=1 Tax=Vibrio variabilis TaxID=990271 RepID=UPI001EFA207E|nr:hydrogenase nickel incorporation protein HypB [Vibrio variabilis]
MCGVCGCDENGNGKHSHTNEEHHHHSEVVSKQRLIEVERSILSNNDRVAAHNRANFKKNRQLVLNLMSSPGSGKTTLLTETLNLLSGKIRCAVIEGDQQTENDANRIRATQTPAYQVNTGKGCHLDADMIHHAMHHLAFEGEGIVFIENVGNLVCPASFDLGEHSKVAILSVTEGDDKPLKYPYMFAEADYMIINKIDLTPYVSFDIAKCIENARSVNPAIKVIELSATTHEGMNDWLSVLNSMLASYSIASEVPPTAATNDVMV